MVNFCAVFGCGSRANREKKSLFRLPAVITHQGNNTKELSKRRRQKWLSRISRDTKGANLAYMRVCADHFISGKPSTLQDADNPDWSPSLKLGHEKVTEASSTRDSSRYQRRVERVQQAKNMDAASALLDMSLTSYHAYDSPPAAEDEDKNNQANQTDLGGATIAAMQAEMQRLLSENQNLKKELADERSRQRLFAVL